MCSHISRHYLGLETIRHQKAQNLYMQKRTHRKFQTRTTSAMRRFVTTKHGNSTCKDACIHIFRHALPRSWDDSSPTITEICKCKSARIQIFRHALGLGTIRHQKSQNCYKQKCTHTRFETHTTSALRRFITQNP